MEHEQAHVPALVGRPAPDFDLEAAAAGGQRARVRLADFRERWLLLVFYPADFSLVCPTELSALSQRYDDFVAAGTDVVAISTDAIETHERWLAQPRAAGGASELRFRLASDPQGDVARAYGVFLPGRQVALRGLFVIDPGGIVQYQVVHNLSVGRRADEIFRVLSALRTGGMCAEGWQPGGAAIDPTESLKPGHRVSHFQIEARIGWGAFATVYRAWDERLGRPVALKILKPRDGALPNVQAEARAAAALSHPNICTVYGIDDSEGLSMIVMEHLSGQPLTKLIEAGPTPPELVRDIARQIAAGMAAAHERGLTHGDLKPANIMLTTDGVVKLLDFGLSFRQPLAGARTGDSTLYVDSRTPGAIAGTPSYMSPEQAAGEPSSPASDVFAFGLILYELLLGRKAFGDSNVLQVLNEIREVDPAALAAELPEPFQPLLKDMLARDVSARTITMAQIRDALSGTPAIAG